MEAVNAGRNKIVPARQAYPPGKRRAKSNPPPTPR